MTTDINDIARAIIDRAGNSRRFLVAIAGPPGAGKSTLADLLTEALRSLGESSEVLPMDGFHMDDGILRARGLLERKGSPETFDVRGFLDIVAAVRSASEDILVPVFDRSRELAISAARVVEASTRFVLVEGNYLLLDHGQWSRLEGKFDYSILISPPVAILESRLMNRWLGFGLSEGAARSKTHNNDLKNGTLVRDHSRPVDLVLH